MMTPLNPATLPANDNINPYAFNIDLAGQWFMQKGKMIAYYGQIQFESLMATSLSGLVGARFSSPLYVGEWVVASGQGKLVLGDRGYDLNSFDLEDGNLTIKAANLLAFQTGLSLKQSIIPGYLTLLGTGKFVASSNGPVIFVEPPMRVDPDALVGWADCPSPCEHYDANWMAASLAGMFQGMMGRNSGEERQLDFTGTGTVLMQSSEGAMGAPGLLRELSSKVPLLNNGELQSLHTSIGAKLAQNQH